MRQSDTHARKLRQFVGDDGPKPTSHFGATHRQLGPCSAIGVRPFKRLFAEPQEGLLVHSPSLMLLASSSQPRVVPNGATHLMLGLHQPRERPSDHGHGHRHGLQGARRQVFPTFARAMLHLAQPRACRLHQRMLGPQLMLRLPKHRACCGHLARSIRLQQGLTGKFGVHLLEQRVARGVSLVRSQLVHDRALPDKVRAVSRVRAPPCKISIRSLPPVWRIQGQRLQHHIVALWCNRPQVRQRAWSTQRRPRKACRRNTLWRDHRAQGHRALWRWRHIKGHLQVRP
mmetsp:Transcript_131636/g.421112  ORF Transcript_131636/g.421112 Transcript_131636/m.421112 type:complete len:286 (+) Transcript_131636:1668-2525(+)